MSNTLLHTLIAQQLENIMKDKGITMYRLMQEGINQSNIEALLNKKDVSYTVKTLSKMLKRLDENGYLEYEKYHGINLTKKGNQLAQTIRQKQGILLEFFEILGIGKDIANQDAEGIEHHLNPKTIKQLRKFITFLKSNPVSYTHLTLPTKA